MADSANMFDRLKAALPGATFFPPATEIQIQRVERALGQKFPRWLRDLYLHCNGIQTTKDKDAYLLALEDNDDFRYSVTSWNKFQRDEWNGNLSELKECRPEVDWSVVNPHQVIIIGMVLAVEWAIFPECGPKIIWYDVRNESEWTVVARDLVEACLKNEADDKEIQEDLFRGRTSYQAERVETPTQRDIDKMFVAIDYLHMGAVHTGGAHSPWSIMKATSQRPGEQGELFIIRYGSDVARLVSRDGNFPFVMRLKKWKPGPELSCVVWGLKTAVFKIMSAQEAVMRPYDSNGNPTPPSEEALREIWTQIGTDDPQLEAMADTLCLRDDKRLEEENQLG